MHPEPPQPLVLQIVQRQRVVEVLGVGGIDGEHEALRQIAIARDERPFRIQHGRSSLGKRSVREHRLQFVARHNEIHSHPHLVGRIGDNLLDMPRSRALARGKLGDAHAHEGPVGNIRIVGA